MRSRAAGAGRLDGQRAGRPPHARAQPLVAQQRPEQRLQARVIDLAREVLEEAFELVEVAVGGGQEARRVGIGLLVARAGNRAQLDLELVAEALNPPAHAHELAALEAPGEHVGVAEGARDDRARAVAQLDGQVWRAGAGDLALLARAREHRVDVLVETQRGDRRRLACRCCRASPMMYGASDAAPDLGPPSGWPQGPGDGVRVPGLERRGRRGVERGLVPGLGPGRTPLRADRLGGVLRLPGQPPVHPLRRAGGARDRVADGRDLRGAGAARAARPGAGAGRRAVDALARVQHPPGRSGGGAGGAGGGDPRARCWATCRTRARWR